MLVIFDLDGTLIDSHDVMCLAFAAAYASEVGEGDAPLEGLLARQGVPLRTILQELDLPLSMLPVFARVSIANSGLIMVWDGVRELLDQLTQAGVVMAIATGKEGGRARLVLQELGLLHHFKLVIGGDEIERGKPAPDVVLKIQDRLGFSTESTVVVGDARADIDSAKAAGVRAIVASWNPRACAVEDHSFCASASAPADVARLVQDMAEASLFDSGGLLRG